MLEIYALNESKTKLSFHFLKENQKIILGSKSNLIENIFPGLKMLYFKESHIFSVESTVGHLISNDESIECLCGSIFPISILSNLCENSLKIQTILAFIQVCKCFQPDLYLAVDQSSINNNNIKLNERILKINQFQRNTELPGNFIWSLLVLSEIFNFHHLFQDCIHKLVVIIKQHYVKTNQNKSSNPTSKSFKNTLLPLPLVTDISNEYISTIESNIITYLSTYTTLLENSPLLNYNPKINNEDKSMVDTDISSNSYLNSTTDNSASSSSTSRNIISYDHATTNIANHTSKSSNDYTYIDDKYSEENQLADVSIHSFVTDTSDLSMTPVAYILPPPAPQNHYRNYDHKWQINSASDINTNSIHTMASREKDYYYNDNSSVDINHQNNTSFNNHNYQNYRGDIIQTHDSKTMNKQQLPPYEHNHQYMDKPKHKIAEEQEVIVTDMYNRYGHLINNYSQHDYMHANNISNNNNERRLNSPNNTPMKMRISRDYYYRANIPAFGSSTPRSLIENNNNSNSNNNNNNNNNNGNNKARVIKSYNTTNNMKLSYSDVEDISLFNTSSRKQINKSYSTLSPEDLRISREIALLRLKEAKVKEEIEISRIQAEKGLRENHLKALALKASIARVRNTNNSPAPSRSTNNIVVSNTTDPKQIIPSISSSSSSSSSSSIEQSDRIAEARLRAAQRVREARKTKIANEKQQNLLKNQSKNQKWILRDSKIEQFQLKQNNQNNIYPEQRHSPENKLLDHALFGDEEISNSVSNNENNNNQYNNNSSFKNKVNHIIFEDENDNFDHEIVTSGLYSKEALAAVGLGYSPNSVVAYHSPSPHTNQLEYSNNKQFIPNIDTLKSFQNMENNIHDQYSIMHPNKILTPSTSSTSLISPIKEGVIDIISIKVVRAWGLPECLGGTNAYVVLDWGQYGKSSTQAVINSIEPHFGATLQFKSPYQKMNGKSNVNEHNNVLHMIDCDYISNAGILKVYVYSRNHSISDELIAWGEIDPHEYLLSNNNNNNNNNKQIANLQSTCIVHLFDPTCNSNNISAGSLEYMIIPYFIS